MNIPYLKNNLLLKNVWLSQVGLVVKKPPANAGT